MRLELSQLDLLIDDARFHCPGEAQPVTRAVHLARLAAFYPACRECPQRMDQAGLSRLAREKLSLVQSRSDDRRQATLQGRNYTQIRDLAIELASSHWPIQAGSPSILLGGNGQSSSAEALAAVCEGLRLAGVNVIDVGPTTSPCLRAAIECNSAFGAVLIAPSQTRPHAMALHVWNRHGEPLAAGDSQATRSSPVQRPCRHGGSVDRRSIDRDYVAALAPLFHGLRPLRFIVETRSEPFLGYLRQLLRSTGCELVAARVIAESPHYEQVLGGVISQDNRHTARLVRQVQVDQADFGMSIDPLGESWLLIDERGLIATEADRNQLLGPNADRRDALQSLALLLNELSNTDEPLSAVVHGPR
jgi:phosphomannomutase